MYVSIDQCSDMACIKSTPLQGSSFTALPSSLRSSATGVVRVTFGCGWSGHTQARFALAYSSIGPPASAPCRGGVRTSAWSHVVAVVERSNETAVAALVYVNGTLESKQSGLVPSMARGLAFAGEGGAAIGRVQPMSAPFGYLSGRLDEIAVWNRSLSATEVGASMGQTCTERAGTVLLCYSFDRIDTTASVASNTFADSGTGQPSPLVSVTEDFFAPWCTTRGDRGKLLVSADKFCTAYAESWGFCTEQAHLPGLGFDYSREELFAVSRALANASSVDALMGLAGCVSTPLVLDGNVAGRWAAALSGLICTLRCSCPDDFAHYSALFQERWCHLPWTL